MVAEALDVCPETVPSEEVNFNGGSDKQVPGVPTVSEWGLVVMTLVGLTVGTVVFGFSRLRKGPEAMSG